MYLSQLKLDLRNRITQNWIQNPYHIHQRLWMAFSKNPPESIRQPAPFLYQLELHTNAAPSRILVFSDVLPDWKRAFTNFSVLEEIPKENHIKQISPAFIQPGATFRFSLVANPTKKILNYRSLFQEELKAYPEQYSRANHDKYLEGKKKLEELVASLPQEKKDSFRLEKKNKQSKNMKKVGIYDEQEQIEWLKRQGNNSRYPEQSSGFELIQTEVNNERGEIGYWNSAFCYGQDVSKFQIAQKKDKNSGITHNIKIHTVTFSGILRITDPEKFKIAYTKGIGSGKAFGCGMLLLARI
ncbi:type I-E CRISPR-associated protein Cas6/Cse3/CasE [Leptospira noguchii]|uniref:type I-E CRISPR-associated protein Cas6/Cse3/CasE n=1 Tax=Leptospira noguchii TaxID=28182 RepID=UPI0002489B12|nr:type I-E CRISPR-associated protein Cas6/Cse3/CasE [Leptospira noguchii]EMS89944.1 CRISPR-associated protein Cas6/Cse3/CasE, subtype TIGR01907-like protein [Leptospira noguchii str. Cascata]UOG37100.1 type I-E CRISPR-associated protein Cas6/Cse3/CasE [Leptospira noguchii]